jgi:hypothetical protein
MIVHPPADMSPAEAFVFADLGGFTCSICAPFEMSKAEVEAFAARELGEPMGGWEAVDMSAIGFRTATPNRCNQAPGRLHWFLLGGLQAAGLGLPTKK